MRNPAEAVAKLKGSAEAGRAIRQLLVGALDHPSVTRLVENILAGKPAEPINQKLIEKLRDLVVSLTPKGCVKLPPKTAKANTPIRPEIIKAWGDLSNDPDSDLLADWLRTGAPLGFTQSIPNTGIFPPVDTDQWDADTAESLRRPFEGWTNHPSASEWHDDLLSLVDEAHSKGFCSFFPNMKEAEDDIGIRPVLNKLGVLVKEKPSPNGMVRKARLIWDMKESKINSLCNQGERILLPRVNDVISDVIETYRKGGRPSFVAIDFQDAFHNIPSGVDRAFTTASFEREGKPWILVYNVLVFGSVSSPTLWGRFAAWWTRSVTAISPHVKIQTYVDDPIMVFDRNRRDHKAELGLTMLWTAITGFPVKLSKADSGNSVKWIGANLTVDDDVKAMVVRIPSEKVTELKERLEEVLGKTVIGKKQLQSLAGALSFVAGVVPIMRPFLSSLWAAMKTNDGPQRTRNVIHVRRIAAAVMWINEMLGEKNFPFVRTVRAVRVKTEAILITDASTMGLGGVLIVGGVPKEFFSTPIPHEFLIHTGAKPGDPKHMALWEALCLLLAARTWLTKFPLGSIVRVKADNIGALHLLAKGKARSPDLSIVAREISLDVATGKYEFTLLQHLNTKLNKIADSLSRQHDPMPPPFPSKALDGAKRIPIKVSHDFWVFPKFSRRLIGLKMGLRGGFCVVAVLSVLRF